MKDIRNIANILLHINENEIKNNKIGIVADNKKIMEIRNVVGVFITEKDNYTTLNFEAIGKEDGMCAIEISAIDSYNIDKQELVLKI